MRHDGRGAQGLQALNSVDRWAAVGGGERRSVGLVEFRHHRFFTIRAGGRSLPPLSLGAASCSCGAGLLAAGDVTESHHHHKLTQRVSRYPSENLKERQK